MLKPHYDYLVVGAGLFGSVFAHEAAKQKKRVLVIEKRPHIGGNIYTTSRAGIIIHQYGAHIFHTKNKEIYDYIRQFADFHPFINTPIANYQGELFPLPFNMHTFYALWGTTSPQVAKRKVEEQTAPYQGCKPHNLEEQALSLVGPDIYQKLIKGYSEKQWGKKASDLPAFIIRRLPLRWTFDNNYFDDPYQGIPIGGYTPIIAKMLASPYIDVQTDTDFFSSKR
ncbi:UDP-galactopyranose mutase [Listeria floridensis FSL S10-1187]|uniref:UDP-galactopyranose mutase n=1 Tax=Listeria floridensis FSL S10-1187 TaxID=1265817 RepID=A0ABN0RDL6_9LIST|nr:UDP-galactopyranose mutase [Listeria floridensis FSL S10-1187]